MNALFRGGPFLDVRTRDGRHCGLLGSKEIEVLDDGAVKPVRYLMQGTGDPGDTDGASDPTVAIVISHLLGLGIDPYGDYWPGAVVHDFIFRRRLLQWINGAWSKLVYVESFPDASKGQMDFARANLIFRALMFSLGTDNHKAWVIYNALEILGHRAWDEDARASALCRDAATTI